MAATNSDNIIAVGSVSELANLLANMTPDQLQNVKLDPTLYNALTETMNLENIKETDQVAGNVLPEEISKSVKKNLGGTPNSSNTSIQSIGSGNGSVTNFVQAGNSTSGVNIPASAQITKTAQISNTSNGVTQNFQLNNLLGNLNYKIQGSTIEQVTSGSRKNDTLQNEVGSTKFQKAVEIPSQLGTETNCTSIVLGNITASTQVVGTPEKVANAQHPLSVSSPSEFLPADEPELDFDKTEEEQNIQTFSTSYQPETNAAIVHPSETKTMHSTQASISNKEQFSVDPNPGLSPQNIGTSLRHTLENSGQSQILSDPNVPHIMGQISINPDQILRGLSNEISVVADTEAGPVELTIDASQLDPALLQQLILPTVSNLQTTTESNDKNAEGLSFGNTSGNTSGNLQSVTIQNNVNVELPVENSSVMSSFINESRGLLSDATTQSLSENASIGTSVSQTDSTIQSLPNIQISQISSTNVVSDLDKLKLDQNFQPVQVNLIAPSDGLMLQSNPSNLNNQVIIKDGKIVKNISSPQPKINTPISTKPLTLEKQVESSSSGVPLMPSNVTKNPNRVVKVNLPQKSRNLNLTNKGIITNKPNQTVQQNFKEASLGMTCSVNKQPITLGNNVSDQIFSADSSINIPKKKVYVMKTISSKDKIPKGAIVLPKDVSASLIDQQKKSGRTPVYFSVSAEPCKSQSERLNVQTTNTNRKYNVKSSHPKSQSNLKLSGPLSPNSIESKIVTSNSRINNVIDQPLSSVSIGNPSSPDSTSKLMKIDIPRKGLLDSVQIKNASPKSEDIIVQSIQVKKRKADDSELEYLECKEIAFPTPPRELQKAVFSRSFKKSKEITELGQKVKKQTFKTEEESIREALQQSKEVGDREKNMRNLARLEIENQLKRMGQLSVKSKTSVSKNKAPISPTGMKNRKLQRPNSFEENHRERKKLSEKDILIRNKKKDEATEEKNSERKFIKERKSFKKSLEKLEESRKRERPKKFNDFVMPGTSKKQKRPEKKKFFFPKESTDEVSKEDIEVDDMKENNLKVDIKVTEEQNISDDKIVEDELIAPRSRERSIPVISLDSELDFDNVTSARNTFENIIPDEVVENKLEDQPEDLDSQTEKITSDTGQKNTDSDNDKEVDDTDHPTEEDDLKESNLENNKKNIELHTKRKKKGRKKKKQSKNFEPELLPEHLKMKPKVKVDETVIDLSKIKLKSCYTETNSSLDDIIELDTYKILHKTKWVCTLCGKPGNIGTLDVLFGPYKVNVASKKTHKSKEEKQGETYKSINIWLHRDCAIWTSSICLSNQKLHGLGDAMDEAAKTVRPLYGNVSENGCPFLIGEIAIYSLNTDIF